MRVGEVQSGEVGRARSQRTRNFYLKVVGNPLRTKLSCFCFIMINSVRKRVKIETGRQLEGKRGETEEGWTERERDREWDRETKREGWMDRGRDRESERRERESGGDSEQMTVVLEQAIVSLSSLFKLSVTVVGRGG